MLKRVLVDLREFMFFYAMICFMFGMIFAVLGLGNWNHEGAAKDNYDDAIATDLAREARVEMYPMEEYRKFDFFLG